MRTCCSHPWPPRDGFRSMSVPQTNRKNLLTLPVWHFQSPTPQKKEEKKEERKLFLETSSLRAQVNLKRHKHDLTPNLSLWSAPFFLCGCFATQQFQTLLLHQHPHWWVAVGLPRGQCSRLVQQRGEEDEEGQRVQEEGQGHGPRARHHSGRGGNIGSVDRCGNESEWCWGRSWWSCYGRWWRWKPGGKHKVSTSSVQDGIYALLRGHMLSTPSLRSLPNIAFKTVLIDDGPVSSFQGRSANAFLFPSLSPLGDQWCNVSRVGSSDADFGCNDWNGGGGGGGGVIFQFATPPPHPSPEGLPLWSIHLYNYRILVPQTAEW